MILVSVTAFGICRTGEHAAERRVAELANMEVCSWKGRIFLTFDVCHTASGLVTVVIANLARNVNRPRVGSILQSFILASSTISMIKQERLSVS